jgi:hypothetical protein
MKPFNLYDDEERSITGTSTNFINPDQEDGTLLEISLSEPENLYTMTSKVREFLKNKPDNFELTLYLVCGNNPSKDAGLFADYIKDLVQPVVVAFRGIIHFDFIHLFIQNVVYVNNSCQIEYSKHKLHDTLKNLLEKPDSYKRFMQRFVDEYWKLNEGNRLPLTELEKLGIKTEIL